MMQDPAGKMSNIDASLGVLPRSKPAMRSVVRCIDWQPPVLRPK